MFEQLRTLNSATKDRTIIDLFADPLRAKSFSIEEMGLWFDYSKTRIDAEIRAALIDLLAAVSFEAKREELFTGRKINTTEDRAVLHTALRDFGGAPVLVEGEDVLPHVRETRDRLAHFAQAVRSGAYRGEGGKITDVVNIGIGGSDLGPVMATLALAPYHDGPALHYVSNVDGAHIHDKLKHLDPQTTLVIVASKTFITIETMSNAKTAFDWMAEQVKDPAAQFAALSSATGKTLAFGIAPDRVFGFADWVGGRYSLWGPIGLGIMIAIGAENFNAFLRGAYEMDEHFKSAPFEQNLPVMLALVGLWHHQVCGYPTRAVLPYEQRLSRFPAYLQQLEMESNGKSVRQDGQNVEAVTGPIVWGEPGTNGQHAFYQLIHQGTQIVPCEFMVGIEGHEAALAHHHRLLVANCLAQSQALMLGRSLEEARQIVTEKGFSGPEAERQAAHRVFAGNRPSTTLIYSKLTPQVLGQLIALYEHRVFVEGVVLGINSFDQWGVELGKELAVKLEPVLSGAASASSLDPSTELLVERIKKTSA